MRHLSNYIALSLLAAAFAGCSSTDTGTTSTSSSGGQDSLTGPLAAYQSQINALAGICVYDSTLQAVTVKLTAADTLAVISKRAVDSALLVDGAVCTDTAVTPNVTALTTSIKSLAIGPSAVGVLDSVNNTVLLDVRNGTFALKSGANGGITVDLGITGTDEVAIMGSAAADKFGCKYDATAGDMVGIKSATSADVTFTNPIDKLTIDLGAGDDSYDQGACTTQMVIYGGAGKDTIIAGTGPGVVGDVYSGGADADTLSYANRTAAVEINLSATVALTAPFAMAVKSAGKSGEADTLTDDFETIIGGSANDTLVAGTGLTAYTLNGGAGNDTFITATTHPAVLIGGTGTDTVDYSARTTGVTVTMGDGLANDGEIADTDNVGKDIENLIGSPQNDNITGNALNNSFTPGLGADTVDGGDGDDTFVATEVTGTTDGNDSFIGGKGLDTIDYSARLVSVCVTLNATVVNGVWSGTHSGLCAADQATSTTALATVVLTTPATYPLAAASESDYIAVDVENVMGSAVADFIQGNALDNVITGGGGADKIVAGAGNDQIDGGAGCAAAPVKVLCGGDPLDILTCTGATVANYGFTVSGVADTCWKVQ